MNRKQSEKFNPGIGATKDLSLRVSVATLVRVLFDHPDTGDLILALERKATLLEGQYGHFVDVKSQPFGGAIQILDPTALQDIVGEYHFDNEQSYREQDFRLFIRPSAWEAVRQFCWRQFTLADDDVIESGPRRELTEEFANTLKIDLRNDQYTSQSVGTILEATPSPTENFYARGYPTVRIYHLFEVRIRDPFVMHLMFTSSSRYTDQDLRELALQDFQNGGYGWYNAVLTLPMSAISTTYLSLSPEARNHPMSLQNHQLDGTVAAILDDITVPKYQKMLLKN